MTPLRRPPLPRPPRRLRASLAAVLSASCVLAGAAVIAAPPALAASACLPVSVSGVHVRCAWSVTLAHGVAQSSPTTATVKGHPSVVVGDLGGHIQALALYNGGKVLDVATGGRQIDAPVSVSPDGRKILVAPTTTRGQRAEVAIATATGVRVASAAPVCAGALCRHLSGIAAAAGDYFTGSPQHLALALHSGNLAKHWAYDNTDSINSTPAVASVPGSGNLTIFTTDQTPNPAQGVQSGGHLRIFTAGGEQLCNVNFGGGPPAPGSFDSSPAVGAFRAAGHADLGVPTIVFGTGESGTNPRRLLGYDAACDHLWTSPALAGPTIGGPSIIDVNGDGTPEIVEEVFNGSRLPVVYVIDGTTGKVKASRVIAHCPGAQGTSSSVVSTTVDGQTYLVAAAGNCGAVLLMVQGSTLVEKAQLGRACGMQNSPLVTVDGPRTMGITVAGYQPSGGRLIGCVRHYTIATTTPAVIGALGWPQFHHDPQLTGTSGAALARSEPDSLVSGQTLASGRSLRSPNGAYTLTMRGDGVLVLRRAGGPSRSLLPRAVRPRAGAKAQMTRASMRLLDTSGHLVWQRAVSAKGRPMTLRLASTGRVGIYAASPKFQGADILIKTL